MSTYFYVLTAHNDELYRASSEEEARSWMAEKLVVGHDCHVIREERDD